MDELISYLKNKKNLINLLTLGIIILGLPLGIKLVRSQQIFTSLAQAAKIEFLTKDQGGTECVVSRDNKLVAVCPNVKVRFTAPTGSDITYQSLIPQGGFVSEVYAYESCGWGQDDNCYCDEQIVDNCNCERNCSPPIDCSDDNNWEFAGCTDCGKENLRCNGDIKEVDSPSGGDCTKPPYCAAPDPCTNDDNWEFAGCTDCGKENLRCNGDIKEVDSPSGGDCTKPPYCETKDCTTRTKQNCTDGGYHWCTNDNCPDSSCWSEETGGTKDPNPCPGSSSGSASCSLDNPTVSGNNVAIKVTGSNLASTNRDRYSFNFKNNSNAVIHSYSTVITSTGNETQTPTYDATGTNKVNVSAYSDSNQASAIACGEKTFNLEGLPDSASCSIDSVSVSGNQVTVKTKGSNLVSTNRNRYSFNFFKGSTNTHSYASEITASTQDQTNNFDGSNSEKVVVKAYSQENKATAINCGEKSIALGGSSSAPSCSIDNVTISGNQVTIKTKGSNLTSSDPATNRNRYGFKFYNAGGTQVLEKGSPITSSSQDQTNTYDGSNSTKVVVNAYSDPPLAPAVSCGEKTYTLGGTNTDKCFDCDVAADGKFRYRYAGGDGALSNCPANAAACNPKKSVSCKGIDSLKDQFCNTDETPPGAVINQYRFALDPTTLSRAEFKNYPQGGSVENIVISDTSPGQKTVFVQFKDSAGNMTAPIPGYINYTGPDPKISGSSCTVDLQDQDCEKDSVTKKITKCKFTLKVNGNDFGNTKSQLSADTNSTEIREWTDKKIVARTAGRLDVTTGKTYTISLTRSDGVKTSATCDINTTQISLGAKLFGRTPRNFDQDNVVLSIFEMVGVGASSSPSSFKVASKSKETVTISKEGVIDNIKTALREGTNYIACITAPLSVRVCTDQFTAVSGNNIIQNFQLPWGDVNGDGCINNIDATKCKLDWGPVTSNSNKICEANRDGVDNVYEWSILIWSFNKCNQSEPENI